MAEQDRQKPALAPARGKSRRPPGTLTAAEKRKVEALKKRAAEGIKAGSIPANVEIRTEKGGTSE